MATVGINQAFVSTENYRFLSANALHFLQEDRSGSRPVSIFNYCSFVPDSIYQKEQSAIPYTCTCYEITIYAIQSMLYKLSVRKWFDLDLGYSVTVMLLQQVHILHTDQQLQ